MFGRKSSRGKAKAERLVREAVGGRNLAGTSIYLIYNPKAGSYSEYNVNNFVHAFSAVGATVVPIQTKSKGHAKGIASSIMETPTDGFSKRVIVAMGGDGTSGEVLEGMVEGQKAVVSKALSQYSDVLGDSAQYGATARDIDEVAEKIAASKPSPVKEAVCSAAKTYFFPYASGTANDGAKAIGCGSPSAAIRNLAEGLVANESETAYMSLLAVGTSDKEGDLQERLTYAHTGIGFMGNIAARVDNTFLHRFKGYLKGLIYPLAALLQIPGQEAYEVNLEIDGQPVEIAGDGRGKSRLYSLDAGQVPRLGSINQCFPGADPFNNAQVMILDGTTSKAQGPLTLLKAKAGRHTRDKGVHMYSTLGGYRGEEPAEEVGIPPAARGSYQHFESIISWSSETPTTAHVGGEVLTGIHKYSVRRVNGAVRMLSKPSK